jgi:hypothetical protein
MVHCIVCTCQALLADFLISCSIAVGECRSVCKGNSAEEICSLHANVFNQRHLGIHVKKKKRNFSDSTMFAQDSALMLHLKTCRLSWTMHACSGGKLSAHFGEITV